jgi:hypothetical protein
MKKQICLLLSNFLLSVYSRFRECSGLSQETKKRLNKYKQDSTNLKQVESNIPRLKSEIEQILYENRFYKSRLDATLQDLKDISILYKSSSYDDIRVILDKYDFQIQLKR